MPRPGKQTTERAKDFKGTLRQLLSALRQYKLSLIVVMVFAILSTIFNIAGPKILAKATTALATGWIAKLRGIGSIDFAYIGKILLTLLAMYLCSAAFSFIQGWLMTGLSQKVCYDFRRQISEKINRLPLAYFEKRTVGEVLSRITNDVDTLGQSLNQSVTQLITSITTMIGVLIMMLSISPKMTLIALLILPVSLVLVMLVVRFSQKYFKAQQATLGVVNGQVEEVYSGHNVIKAFNREAAVLEDFNAANDKLFESAWKSQFLSGLMQPIMNFVGNLGYVAVAIVGSIFAANGIITIGDIQAFIQYVRNFTQPIQQLAQVSNMLQSMAAAAERVFEFLNEPEEDQLADPARRADPACIDGQVTFDHVRFGYVPEKTIIHDFSCKVQPGQKVAIVGPTGAGKTTMVKLLMRFYDVDSGSITLNGHDIRDFDRSALREGFGMVLQDTWLFKGTIMENIRYGRLDATDEEVEARLRGLGNMRNVDEAKLEKSVHNASALSRPLLEKLEQNDGNLTLRGKTYHVEVPQRVKQAVIPVLAVGLYYGIDSGTVAAMARYIFMFMSMKPDSADVVVRAAFCHHCEDYISLMEYYPPADHGMEAYTRA